MKGKSLKLLVMVLTLVTLCSVAVFAEGDTSDWVSKAWARLYESQAFQPDKAITRIEMIALINSRFDFKEQQAISFTDIPDSSPYYKEVSKAFTAGYVLGTGNNLFSPDKEITKAEAYVMIARAMKLDLSRQPEKLLAYKDAGEVPGWAAGAVEALLQKGWFEGKNKVKVSEKLLGSEAVEMLEMTAAKTEAGSGEATPAQKEGKGGGKSPLNLLGAYFVAIENNKSVELGKVQDGGSAENMIIKLSFDRGVVRDYWEDNQKQIKLVDNKGSIIECEVFRIEGVEAEKENIFIKPVAEVKSGKTINLVIGKDLRANNGNTLGSDVTITFTVK